MDLRSPSIHDFFSSNNSPASSSSSSSSTNPTPSSIFSPRNEYPHFDSHLQPPSRPPQHERIHSLSSQVTSLLFGPNDDIDEEHKENDAHNLSDYCAVCLSSGSDAMLLPCTHSFHARCILTWVEKQASFSCPLCRQNIQQFVPIDPLDAADSDIDHPLVYKVRPRTGTAWEKERNESLRQLLIRAQTPNHTTPPPSILSPPSTPRNDQQLRSNSPRNSMSTQSKSRHPAVQVRAPSHNRSRSPSPSSSSSSSFPLSSSSNTLSRLPPIYSGHSTPIPASPERSPTISPRRSRVLARSSSSSPSPAPSPSSSTTSLSHRRTPVKGLVSSISVPALLSSHASADENPHYSSMSLQPDFSHSNPELSHTLERGWGGLERTNLRRSQSASILNGSINSQMRPSPPSSSSSSIGVTPGGSVRSSRSPSISMSADIIVDSSSSSNQSNVALSSAAPLADVSLSEEADDLLARFMSAWESHYYRSGALQARAAQHQPRSDDDEEVTDILKKPQVLHVDQSEHSAAALTPTRSVEQQIDDGTLDEFPIITLPSEAPPDNVSSGLEAFNQSLLNAALAISSAHATGNHRRLPTSSTLIPPWRQLSMHQEEERKEQEQEPRILSSQFDDIDDPRYTRVLRPIPEHRTSTFSTASTVQFAVQHDDDHYQEQGEGQEQEQEQEPQVMLVVPDESLTEPEQDVSLASAAASASVTAPHNHSEFSDHAMNPPYYPAIAGGFAGLLASGYWAFASPSGSSSSASPGVSLFRVIRSTMPGVAIYFSTYEAIKAALGSGRCDRMPAPDDRVQSTLTYFGAAAMGGAASQSWSLLSSGQSLAVRPVALAGYRFGLQFAVFEQVKNLWARRKADAAGHDTACQSHLHLSEVLLAAAVGGAVAGMAVHPIERVWAGRCGTSATDASHPHANSARGHVATVVSSAVRSGLASSLARILPGCVITAVSYEMGARYLEGNRETNHVDLPSSSSLPLHSSSPLSSSSSSLLSQRSSNLSLSLSPPSAGWSRDEHTGSTSTFSAPSPSFGSVSSSVCGVSSPVPASTPTLSRMPTANLPHFFL